MARMMDATCKAVMAVVAHCLSVGGTLATVLRRAVTLLARLASSVGPVSVSRLPLVRQQFLDPAVQLRGQPREHVLQIRPRLVPIELGRLQQAHHHRGPLARELAANEQPIAPAKGT